MKFFYWVLFGFLLWSSLALNLKPLAAEPKYNYTTLTSREKKPTVKAAPKAFDAKPF